MGKGKHPPNPPNTDGPAYLDRRPNPTRVSPIKYSSLLLFLLLLSGCEENNHAAFFDFEYQTAQDRTWLGPEFLAVPLESWRTRGGRIECTGGHPEMRANLLTNRVDTWEPFKVTFRFGQLVGTAGRAGLRFGIQDATDDGVKSLAYYGEGLEVGIETYENGEAELFLADSSVPLPADFDRENMVLTLRYSGFDMIEALLDDGRTPVSLKREIYHPLRGMLALFNTYEKGQTGTPARYWFDDLEITGAAVRKHAQDEFGPILFSMYTLSRNTLRMTVQMPPLGAADGRTVDLQVQDGNRYVTLARAIIDSVANIAVFEVEDWDDERDHSCYLVYHTTTTTGIIKNHMRAVTIRRDPGDRPLTLAALTCQEWSAYPYQPLIDNLASQDPDLLYFSGDQIYEHNGGYGIERQDPDLAVTNYLGKWYMFGWAFGELMRDRPTIVITDDHEVYQGNLWGAGGETVTPEEWERDRDARSGFVQPLKMIDVVMRTNTSHLPRPADATPMKNGIPVYYTDLVYGEVSFAMVSDRAFKSGPENVAWWDGRKDHIRDPNIDVSRLEDPALELLGERQLAFLDDWARDWRGAKMKCFLSQTIFGNAATHHGTATEDGILYGDLDSGGWPKGGRDVAVESIRRAGAFHVCGDQHLPLMVQYGTDARRDAGWVFCTPAISVGYQRRFWPDSLGVKLTDAPAPGLPNTGNYRDLFGNHLFVRAVASPPADVYDEDRYVSAGRKTSGYGLIVFDKDERSITSSCVPFNTPAGKVDNMAGWPVVLTQPENYGQPSGIPLPEVEIRGLVEPVVQVLRGDELVAAYRTGFSVFQGTVREPGDYTLRVGDPERDVWREVAVSTAGAGERVSVTFE